MELKVSYPITFLKDLRVTDWISSRAYVGAILAPMASTSSIGTLTT